MEALGTLAGGIAHDFNNILGAIIGNVELARQDVGATHPAMQSLDEIRKASHRAKDLVQRILTFASQHQEPQSVIRLRPVVEEAVTFLRATLPAGVEVAATFDPDAPTVLADSTQIHQVLINLCTNAWQAMNGHAGRIDIRLDSITLDAEAARADANLQPGHFARLCVTDTGTGMDAATLERIFEPFFTTKPVGQGTGLGLSVVHGIVKAHDGAITVTSQPGEGTTFSLYFAAAEAPERRAAPEDVTPTLLPAPGGHNVLYLDDEESLVFLVTRMLERLGYRVSGYTRAEEALAAVRADPGQFDLVVTDLNMPGMSGLDVARELARLRPDLPVVLASGYITEELRAQAPQAGVRQLIYKPSTVEELCAAVQRLAGAPKRR
jgi:CheY-like chemotaxis protein